MKIAIYLRQQADATISHRAMKVIGFFNSDRAIYYGVLSYCRLQLPQLVHLVPIEIPTTAHSDVEIKLESYKVLAHPHMSSNKRRRGYCAHLLPMPAAKVCTLVCRWTDYVSLCEVT